MKFSETYRTAAVNCNHFSKQDNVTLMALSQETDGLVGCRDTGFFVKLHNEPDLNRHPDLSDECNSILVEAAHQGFECVEFDSAAATIDGLTLFDW